MNAIHRLVMLLSTLALATGCPGEEAQPPVADDGNDTQPSEESDTGDTDSPGTQTDDGTVDDTGTDTGEEQCVEEPTEPVELLNGCTDATCEPFANTPERLPLLQADGSLPPLP